MPSVRTASPNRSMRPGFLGILPVLAALPALIAASPGNPVPRVATWGTLEETGVLRVVWVLPVPAGEADTPSARLWMDDLRIAREGEVIRLGADGPDALLWVIPGESIAAPRATGPHTVRITFEPEASPIPRPPGPGIPETVTPPGLIPAVFCLDCSDSDRRVVEQLLGEGKPFERRELRPAQSDILQVTDARVFPNPFQPFHEDATIAFSLSQDADVTITAFDGNGDFTDTVYRGALTAGGHEIPWGGQTEDGRKLGNGVYLLRIVAETGARQESQVLKAVVWNER